MRIKARATIFFALTVLLLLTETNSWRRRRRRRSSRRRRVTSPCAGSRDCSVSSWSGWSSCSWPCGLSGVKRRSRYITISAVNCGTCPYSFSESQNCNREPSLCLHGSIRNYRGCTCRAGWTGTCCGTGKSRCDQSFFLVKAR